MTRQNRARFLVQTFFAAHFTMSESIAVGTNLLFFGKGWFCLGNLLCIGVMVWVAMRRSYVNLRQWASLHEYILESRPRQPLELVRPPVGRDAPRA